MARGARLHRRHVPPLRRDRGRHDRRSRGRDRLRPDQDRRALPLDRVAKYNQLLRIEEELGEAAEYPGWRAFRRRLAGSEGARRAAANGRRPMSTTAPEPRRPPSAGAKPRRAAAGSPPARGSAGTASRGCPAASCCCTSCSPTSVRRPTTCAGLAAEPRDPRGGQRAARGQRPPAQRAKRLQDPQQVELEARRLGMADPASASTSCAGCRRT